MKIEVDTHTHSIASLHAYSTIEELSRSAKKAGLKGFAITDHGPALQGYPHPYYFGNLRILPSKINGVRLFRGVELNIMNAEGAVDLTEGYIDALDFAMAGLHEGCFRPSSRTINTKALIAAIENPLVSVITHPANPAFPVYYEEVVDAAVKNGKALEINNSSFKVRVGSDETCPILAKLCAERGALISCGSDAHYHKDIGRFDLALPVIKKAGIKPHQIVNRTLKSFLLFLESRRP
ncbi:MAG: phosphatase [Spirochaetaceae bacterium]|jgi:putative hydrolase|nr:phosphatase [Spirochaetaceae bacterium]